ncbi:hypothetical protein EYF80_040662 [Liparis tanakae]|uniref:Uncharacterized protein n=1 Tax=Liparis tanakae TaxID=230148 RepID=A0A4Z2G7L4_9TELE|nr:hypothetical protein EYF80_040662 [Liparis tanakae]
MSPTEIPTVSTYLLVWELLCMNQERLLSTYMAHALSSFPSIMSFMVLILATPNAGSGALILACDWTPVSWSRRRGGKRGRVVEEREKRPSMALTEGAVTLQAKVALLFLVQHFSSCRRGAAGTEVPGSTDGEKRMDET